MLQTIFCISAAPTLIEGKHGKFPFGSFLINIGIRDYGILSVQIVCLLIIIISLHTLWYIHCGLRRQPGIASVLYLVRGIEGDLKLGG